MASSGFVVEAHRNDGTIKIIGTAKIKKEALNIAQDYAMQRLGHVSHNRKDSSFTIENNGRIIEIVTLRHMTPIETGR
jgi:hypothetical protein